MQKFKFIVLAILLMVATTGTIQAQQTIRVVNGKEVIVHTNPIPVVLHRLVPPNYGRHITQAELERGVPKNRFIRLR